MKLRLHRKVFLGNRYMGMISEPKQLEQTKNCNTDLKANVTQIISRDI